MDHSKLLKEFTSKTGAEQVVGKKFLQEHSWNVQKASRAFNLMQSAGLPPVGPRKNAAANQPVPSQESSQSQSISTTNTLEGRKLKRGLSKTTDNVILVTKARETVLNDIVETCNDEQHFVDTPEYTFILPDLTKFAEDFRAFLQKDLVETATLVSLEQAGRLNWWADIGVCNRLLPLATTGDGNCLLHAASLGMWGFHDRQLTLRQALFRTLSSDLVKSSFWRRWRWHQIQINKQSGLILSEKEWQLEWTNLLKLASTVPRTQPGSTASCCDSPATKGLMERKEKDSLEETEVFYESLEEFHVFVLAHVLRRPIIVVADTVLKNCSGEALAPIPFGGIYLPLESRPENCHRSPLLLTYDAAHFSALVPMDLSGDEAQSSHRAIAAIPVVDPELNLLPIHFLVDPGPQFVWNKDELEPDKVKKMEAGTKDRLQFVQDYLDLSKMPISEDDVDSSRPRSNSWSGPKEALNRSMSVESSESGYSGSSNNIHNNHFSNHAGLNIGDNGKKKDKVKTTKQVHSVVKSFGSIGKTMSKKLKNLGGLKNAGKLEGEKERFAKPVSVTQSTNMTVLTDLLKDKSQVLCAKLRHKRLDYQEQMVQNYLKAAHQSFEHDREVRKSQDEEMKKMIERRRIEQETPVACMSPGCKEQGTPAMSYLCKQCYNQQRKEALDLEKGKSELKPDITVKNPTTPDLHRQNTLVNLGSSKFYTYADEDQSLSNKYDNTSNNVTPANLNNAQVTREKVKKAPLELSRSSFYDEALCSPRPLVRKSPPGTARIINNLQEEQLKDMFEAGDRQSSHNFYHNERPKPPVETRQNIVNLNSGDYQSSTIYQPKVQNVAHNHQKGNDGHTVPTTLGQNAQTQFIVSSSNISGPYISRIEVGNSPSGEYPPKQQCRSDGCRNFGFEDKEYYCDKCYALYDRNRTTFL